MLYRQGLGALANFREGRVCLSGPTGIALPSGCQYFDFHAAGDIDLLDFGALQDDVAAPIT